MQRDTLKNKENLHPLLRRIMEIHVTEEARHLSFAEQYLRRQVPQLGWWKKKILAIVAPRLLGRMAGMMTQPSQRFINHFHIPSVVIREAFLANEEYKSRIQASLARVTQLCSDLDILNDRNRSVWKRQALV